MNFIRRVLTVENSLWLIVLLSLSNGLVLAWYNTIARDDWDFIYFLNTYGFFGAIEAYYFSWQGRVSAYIFTYGTLLSNNYINGLFVYYILLLVVFISSIYCLLTAAFKYFGVSCKPLSILLFSTYLFVFFQEIVYDKSTIYWLAASASYYAGLAFALAGFALIVSTGQSWIKIFFSFFFFLFAGCSVEHYGFILILLLAIALASTYIITDKNIFHDNKIKIIVAIIACSVGIAIMMLCPGLEFRRAGFSRPDILSALKISVNSFYHFYKFMFLPELGKLILFSSPFIYWGSKRNNFSYGAKSKYIRVIALILLIMLIIVIVNFLILAYGTGGIGQPRTLTHIAFILAFGFSLVAFITGYTLQISKNIALLLIGGAVIVFVISFAQNTFRTLPESIKYSKSESDRIELILKEKRKDRTEPLIVDSLYYNEYVMYRSDEISPDTASSWNKAIVRALELDYSISSNSQTFSED